jgi:hypothetical protein
MITAKAVTPCVASPYAHGTKNEAIPKWCLVSLGPKSVRASLANICTSQPSTSKPKSKTDTLAWACSHPATCCRKMKCQMRWTSSESCCWTSAESFYAYHCEATPDQGINQQTYASCCRLGQLQGATAHVTVGRKTVLSDRIFGPDMSGVSILDLIIT